MGEGGNEIQHKMILGTLHLVHRVRVVRQGGGIYHRNRALPLMLYPLKKRGT